MISTDEIETILIKYDIKLSKEEIQELTNNVNLYVNATIEIFDNRIKQKLQNNIEDNE